LAVVLVVPPGVPHAQQQVAVDEADDPGGRPAARDLGVAGVVAMNAVRAENRARSGVGNSAHQESWMRTTPVTTAAGANA
jgi:hypothetical protein